MIDNENVHQLTYEHKNITLVGTAHVSRESVELVASVIEEEKPDTVCLELCQSRYESIIHPNQWQDMDIFEVVKEQKAFLLLSNLILSYFQKKIGGQLGIKPGEEMIRAIRAAEAVGASIYLVDTDLCNDAGSLRNVDGLAIYIYPGTHLYFNFLGVWNGSDV